MSDGFDDLLAQLAGDTTPEQTPQHLIGTCLAGRFEVRRKLGEGGMGVVYEAFDREHDELVALKTIRTVDADGVYRLKKEFRALAGLVHPHLVALRELFGFRGRWFFTMDLVAGVPFIEHVRREADAPAPAPHDNADDARAMYAPTEPSLDTALCERELRAALPQLVAGVQAIHGAGKLHRDLKPSNVLVDDAGHVTILDFGLAQPLRPDDERSRDMAQAGTPAYMAPEQATPNAACAASDWYGVGVMLYEALTGLRPFTGALPDLLAAKQHAAVTDPRKIVADAPGDLAELSMRLLSADPSARPGVEEITSVVGTPEASEPISVSPGRDGVFVGRERELAQLHTAYATSKAGEPAIVYVEGVSGMGKSRLLARFIERLKGEAVVLAGRCYEREHVPFKALDGIVDALSRHLTSRGRLHAAKLTPRHLPELCRVFPVLERVPAFRDETLAPVSEPQDMRRRAFAALRELLGRVAERQPLIVVIDDLQWGDVDSGSFLMGLLEPPDAPRLMLIMSYRSDEVSRSTLLTQLRRQVERDTRQRSTTVTLPPLDDDDARHLARALLADVPASLVDATVRSADGNPFFLSEIAKASRAGDVADVSLAQLIETRVSSLPTTAGRLLQVVAIAGRPIHSDIALVAAELPMAGDVISQLRAASLLRTQIAGSGWELETYHDRIRETVAASLTDAAHRACHLGIAEAYEASADPPVDALALHYREAGANARARRFVVQAAEQAARAQAFERAADLYQVAIGLSDAKHVERDLRRALADALAHAGLALEAADAYLAVADVSSDEEALGFDRRAAQVLLSSGHVERGLQVARRVMRRIGLWMPRSQLGAILTTVVRLLALLIRGVRFQERREEDVSTLELRRLDAEWDLFRGLGMIDNARGIYFGASVLRRALRLGEPERVARALGYAAIAWTGLRGAASSQHIKWLQTQEALTERLKSPSLAAFCELSRGTTAYLRGSFDQAAERLEKAEAAYSSLGGLSWERIVCRVYHTWTLFQLGRIRALTEQVVRLVREARSRGDLFAVAMNGCSNAGIVAMLTIDQPEEALRSIEESERSWPTETVLTTDFMHVQGRGFICLYQGDAVAGHARLVDRWSRLKSSGLLMMQILRREMLWLRGALAVAAAREMGPGRAADKLLKDASHFGRKLTSVHIPSAGAHALLIHAAVACTQGQRDRSVKLLEQAIEDLEAEHLAGYAAAARHQLGLLTDQPELTEAAEAFLTEQGVVRPNRFASMLAPGFDGP